MLVEDAAQRTRFFRSTLGVFQGGGCRAAGFVGAYEVAVRRGVRLTEVAGTSAGALVSALIGGGATPAQLLEFVPTIDFGRFLAEPKRTARRTLVHRAAGMSSLLSKLADIYYDLGLHSSDYIEEWVESNLRVLLPEAHSPIAFRELVLPTWIVAADAKGERIKVWSSRDTPDESVSAAVRASCAIPLFFQPVEGRYFDGGVLSNLPTFVFNRHAQSDRPLSSRLIAFALKATTQEASQQHTLLRLVNTVIDGSQDLQLKMQGHIPLLSIPTGDIRATDFHRMSTDVVKDLIAKGRAAAEQFFDSELGVASDPYGIDRFCYGLAEFYAAVVDNSDKVSEVLISETDTEFVYSLFPTLLDWTIRGVRISALLARHENSSHSKYRRALLYLLGATVKEVDAPHRAPMLSMPAPGQQLAQLSECQAPLH